mgnify:CR=1 FL=1
MGENNPEVQIEFAPIYEGRVQKLAKKYRHIETDLKSLYEALMRGETPGDRIPGLVGFIVYKERVNNRDSRKGKRGGYRVIYQVKTADLVVLLFIYSKNDQENIATDDIKRIIEDQKSTNED